MDVTILGGAAAAPNPGQGCAGYLVRAGDNSIVIDCGPDTFNVLRQQQDFRSVSAVVISHLHSDHTLDLVPYRYALRYAPGAPSPRIPLWMPPDGLAFLERLAGVFAVGGEQPGTFWEDVFALNQFDPAAPLTIADIEFSFQLTQHAIPCWAMRLRAEGRTLVYTADTALNDQIVAFARGADLLITEATMPEGADLGPSPIHQTSGQAGELAERAGVGRLVLSHYWIELDPDRLISDARAHYSGDVALATPGLRVPVAATGYGG